MQERSVAAEVVRLRELVAAIVQFQPGLSLDAKRIRDVLVLESADDRLPSVFAPWWATHGPGDLAPLFRCHEHAPGRLRRYAIAHRDNRLLDAMHEASVLDASFGDWKLAAQNGNVAALAFFVDHGYPLYLDYTMGHALSTSHVNIVAFLVDHGAVLRSPSLSVACRGRSLAMVEYVHRQGLWHPVDVSSLAVQGALDIIQYLHEHDNQGFNAATMDAAAAAGQLSIVRFLHEHRSDGCSAAALTSAAACGHLDVVRFLKENRSEGDVARAVAAAAGREQWPVVMYLLDLDAATTDTRALAATWYLRLNGFRSWSEKALVHAVRHMRLDLVDFVHTTSASASFSPLLMDTAARFGCFDLFVYLHRFRAEGCTEDARVYARSLGHTDILAYMDLHGLGATQDVDAAMRDARTHGTEQT
ncbi:hypothetical protein SDRG_16797 [Saprolegnia diclina VS20]|uniref:Ankyrin repeat domain containing protein n=1 Tax=Saprolegnia diclina (strain VS20) TaxID=1156394 RepID=T0PIY2_SAPDV|nr:hypothetical protein SDRG_16797 [Saprolegnia diclina VS20]EQC25334.1 hypothetical protein SDRG_16797 [Saprolegnia diclina VS20]|eukprot:XP_008621239.1 hypothetical protein SDRG_16797 [Saprolegnia diclina VS20]